MKMETIFDCECEDYPITYCKKCGSFFLLDRDGNRTQLDLEIKNEQIDSS